MFRFALLTALGLAFTLQVPGRSLDHARAPSGPTDSAAKTLAAGSGSALATDPVISRAQAHYERGNAQLLRGAFADAVTEFDRVLRLVPEHLDAPFRRGIAAFSAGDDASAVSDFDSAVSRAPSDAYRVAWAYLASVRQGREARRELGIRAAQVALDEWPGPLLSWYLGRRTLAQVVEAVRDADLDRQIAKTCEAGFFVGRKLELDGRVSDAERWYATAVATCDTSRVELAVARATLKSQAPDTTGVAARIEPERERAGTSEPAATIARVTTTTVNYRRGPGLGHERIGTLQPNTPVSVEESVGEWLRIRLEDGTRAFLSASFTEEVHESEESSSETSAVAVPSARLLVRDDAQPPRATSVENAAFPMTFVTISDVNYREGPGTGHGVLGTLPAAHRVTVEGEQRGWYRIVLSNGSRGFVYGTLLSPAGTAGDTSEVTSISPQRFVATTRVNLRGGPGTEHTRVGLAQVGDVVLVDGEIGDWLRVRHSDDRTGFLHKDYVKPTPGS